jgi:hypothetical protein
VNGWAYSSPTLFSQEQLQKLFGLRAAPLRQEIFLFSIPGSRGSVTTKQNRPTLAKAVGYVRAVLGEKFCFATGGNIIILGGGKPVPFKAGTADQFNRDILNGVHQPHDVYKIALGLRTTATDWNPSLKTYDSAHELPAVGNYTRGGIALTGFTVFTVARSCDDSGHARMAFVDWPSEARWPNATFAADCAIIYNASRDNKVLMIMEFGLTRASAGAFTLSPPEPVAVVPEGNIMMFPLP